MAKLIAPEIEVRDAPADRRLEDFIGDSVGRLRARRSAATE